MRIDMQMYACTRTQSHDQKAITAQMQTTKQTHAKEIKANMNPGIFVSCAQVK